GLRRVWLSTWPSRNCQISLASATHPAVSGDAAPVFWPISTKRIPWPWPWDWAPWQSWCSGNDSLPTDPWACSSLSAGLSSQLWFAWTLTGSNFWEKYHKDCHRLVFLRSIGAISITYFHCHSLALC